MKHRIIKLTATAVLSSTFVVGAVAAFNKKAPIVTSAINLPTTIDLRDNTDEEIVNYYSSLSSLSDDELTGSNLLKNLKGIIASNVTYYSYSQIEHAYPITDRDWANSPANGINGYDHDTNKITKYSYKNDEGTNPYIHMLYHDYTNPSKDKTHYKGDGDVSEKTKSFDNEHAWSQSHGFATNSENNITGAGSDLHHLIAGTQYGNRTLHNNYSYGFVKQNDGNWSDKIYEK